VSGGETVEHDLHRRPAAPPAVPDLFAGETDLAGELGHLPSGIPHVAAAFMGSRVVFERQDERALLARCRPPSGKSRGGMGDR
jgi:hypothetical protein